MRRSYNNILQTGKCPACNSNYVDITIGRKHIYGTCIKCERRDEIGLVINRTDDCLHYFKHVESTENEHSFRCVNCDLQFAYKIK